MSAQCSMLLLASVWEKNRHQLKYGLSFLDLHGGVMKGYSSKFLLAYPNHASWYCQIKKIEV
ncbi:hypothetical protein WN944_028226 [Citrus x changshan-huyou]|uniref:Uncharacterized protein n=1 Tax=Citrus x changshan-huyou TaxID=2935761 RepID=A0AAP0LJ00_9ROSI